MRTLLLILILVIASPLSHSGDFVNGSTTCPSSGSKQVSTTGYQFYQLSILANPGNTGNIYLGGSSSVTTSTGVVLQPGWTYNAQKPSAGINPANLWIACATNTDGLTWIGSR